MSFIKYIDKSSHFNNMGVKHAIMLLIIVVGGKILDYDTLGRKIQERRIERHMTQATLAEMTGVSANHIGYVENARQHVGLELLDRIAAILGTSLVDLLAEAKSNESNRYVSDICLMLIDCSTFELRIIVETTKSLKASLRKNYRGEMDGAETTMQQLII